MRFKVITPGDSENYSLLGRDAMQFPGNSTDVKVEYTASVPREEEEGSTYLWDVDISLLEYRTSHSRSVILLTLP